MMKHQSKYSPRVVRTPKTSRSANKLRSKEQTEYLRNKIQEANEACQSGEFSKAVQLFSEIIVVEPKNAILYCNRSAAFIRMHLYQSALDDANKSISIDNDWYKGYYRQAIALQCMGRHPEALAAYSSALAQDEKSQQLLQALVDASLRSNLQDTLEPLFEQLDQTDIDNKAFATVAIIGQELLSAEELQPAITVLENSLQLGTEDMSLKGSVYSALSNAYWKSGNVKRALHFMHQDLLTAESLNDYVGVCRVHGNLGNAYFCQSQFTEAEQHHQMQLEIALEQDDTVQAANALAALGHVYVAIANYEEALSSHKRSALLRHESDQSLLEAKELGNVGTVYALLGDFDNAVKCQEENLSIVTDLDRVDEMCHVLALLGGLNQNMKKYEKAVERYQEMLKLSHETGDYDNQCLALSGLGTAYRKLGKVKLSEGCHEQQLKIAIDISDPNLEATAQADLGLTYMEKGDHNKALEYQKSYLESCRTNSDREGEGRAYGNIGDTFQALGQYERAIKYHKLGLSVFKDINDRHSEASLHGNIAVAYQSLNLMGDALQHYNSHLMIAVELKDLRAEACAESNLGDFFSSQEKYKEAVSHYENFLSVANKLNDKTEMCKATHNLAYAYYRIENYNDAIEYYEQNTLLANELDDRESLSMTYCNLGLAYLAMNDYEKSVRCQKLFLAYAREKQNHFNICRALGNLGKIYMQMGDTEEGLRFFFEQARAADKSKNLNLQADCYHEIAKVLEAEENMEEAALRYEKEIAIRRQINQEPVPLYHALIRYSGMLEKVDKLEEAYKYYCEVFQLAKENGHLEQCKTVCELMGKINMKMGKYEKAVIAFRLQLECINDTVEDSIESAYVHINISDCYKEMGDINNAIEHLLQYQEITMVLQLPEEENNAYKKLSDIYIFQQLYQEALVYSEKRLVCCQDLDAASICDAYNDVATAHALLQNYDTSVSYYEQLLKSAREGGLSKYQYEAFKGLGNLYRALKDYEKAMHSHKNALDKALSMDNAEELQADTYNILGDSYNKVGQLQDSIDCYKKALKISEDIESLAIQIQASGRLGKLKYITGKSEEAIECFRSAVNLSDKLQDNNEKIKAFYRLAFGLYLENDIQTSLVYFQRVLDIVEHIEENTTSSLNPESIEFVMGAYQMLQKLFIKTEQYTQALFVAEKSNSINLELLLKKANIPARVHIPLFEKFLQRIRGIKTHICFYSVAIGNLYCWILSPRQGFVKFWQKQIIEKYSDDKLRTLDMDDIVTSSTHETYEKFDDYVKLTRKALGVETHEKTLLDRTKSFAANIEIIDRKQSRKSRIGRPVVMSNTFNGPNAPAYQFRYRQPNIPDQERQSSRNFNWYMDAPAEEMYQIFASEIDSHFNDLKEQGIIKNNVLDLKIVIPKELSLVPFALLREQSFTKYFSELYNLSYSPTLFWLLESKSLNDSESIDVDSKSENIFVFGGGNDATSDEARSVSRIFGSTPVFGNNHLKDDVVFRLTNSIVCHLSSDVAWQTPSLVFPCKVITKDALETREFSADPDIDDFDADPRSGSPAFSDVSLTAKDISELQLQASLFTFGIAPPSSYSDPICPEGLHLIMTCLQMTGCKTLLSSLWPVPDNVRRFFLHGFYQLYNKGVSAFEACQQTIHNMQTHDEFQHPSNWAGFIVYGQNSQLNRQTQSLTKALHEFLDQPNRDAIKVILHLVEKARQRLASDRRTSLYVSESSIMKKIQSNVNWRPMLNALGFRFEKAHDNLPDCVFFPGTEHQDILNNCSNTLYAFLGLTRNGLDAVAKLRAFPNIGLPLIKMLEEVLYYFNQEMSNVQVPFPLPLWRLPGCHEFLSSVGFDVMGIGKTEVTLRSGKIAMRRALQCALQVSKDLFECVENENIEKLVNATDKSFSEIKIRDENLTNQQQNISKKTHSENAINHIGDNVGALKRDRTMSSSSETLSNSSSGSSRSNSFLNSERGLFSSKDTPHISEGAIARKIRLRNQENANLSVPGMKSDMKRYGTMEKLDVSDLVLAEDNQGSESNSDIWENTLRFSPDNRSRLVNSPDTFYEEDIENFLDHFRSKQQKEVSPRTVKQNLKMTKSCGSNLDVPGKTGKRTISMSEVNDDVLSRTSSLSSEESDITYQMPREQEDLFNTREDTRRILIPHALKRLQMTSEYFQNKPTIKTSSIKETLSIDSGVCSPSLSDIGNRRSREISGGFNEIDGIDSTSSTANSKWSLPDIDRKSINSEDFDTSSEVSKKKGWFSKIRQKKKSRSSEDAPSLHTLPAANARQNMEKMKRSSADVLLYEESAQRKSEDDINSNQRHAITQPQQHEQIDRMSSNSTSVASSESPCSIETHLC